MAAQEGHSAGAGSLVARIGRGAARHWLFLLVVAAAVVLRVIVWRAYHPAILILGDTTAYLGGAVDRAHEGAWHPLFYSLFLKPALALGSLSIATAVQHALTVIAAAGLYVLLLRLRIPAVVAALGVTPVLLDAYQLNLEQHILTEALFGFLIVAAVVLVAWWAQGPWWAYALCGVAISLAVGTRFAGLALVPVVLIYLAFRRPGWPAPVFLVAGFAVGLVGYLSWQQSLTGSFALASKSGHVLYGKVATFADCTGVEMPEVERQLCIEEPIDQRAPSYNMWNRDSPLRELQVPPGVEPVDVTGSFSRRFIRHQPLDYARAAAGDFFRFFAWRTPREQEPVRVRRWQFFLRYERMVGVAPGFRKTGGSPPTSLGLDERFSIDQGRARALIGYQSRVYPSGPLMTLMAVLGLAGCFLKVPVAGGRDTRPETILLFLAGCALLLFPALFAAYHFRYVLPALPLLGPAAAIGATAVASQTRSAVARVRARKEAGTASGAETAPEHG